MTTAQACHYRQLCFSVSPIGPHLRRRSPAVGAEGRGACDHRPGHRVQQRRSGVSDGANCGQHEDDAQDRVSRLPALSPPPSTWRSSHSRPFHASTVCPLLPTPQADQQLASDSVFQLTNGHTCAPVLVDNVRSWRRQQLASINMSGLWAVHALTRSI